MAKQQIYPAINGYITKVLKACKLKEKYLGKKNWKTDIKVSSSLTELNSNIFIKAEELEKLLEKTVDFVNERELAFYFKDKVLTCMNELRVYADEAENLTSERYWPVPSYGQLLFSVK